jgi:hypothetical protein
MQAPSPLPGTVPDVVLQLAGVYLRTRDWFVLCATSRSALSFCVMRVACCVRAACLLRCHNT